jgi:fructokinase
MPSSNRTSPADNLAPKIVVLGEALLDHFATKRVVGGAPFNVARNLAALGESPLMVTRIGEDDDARELRREFARFSMPTNGVQVDVARPTGNVKVTLCDGQPEYEIAAGQAWDAIDTAAAINAVSASTPELICFGTLAQRDATSRQAIREVISHTKATRVLDLNLRSAPDNREVSAWSMWSADIVKVNGDELAQLFAWFLANDENDFSRDQHANGPAEQRGVNALMRQFDFQTLIVTRGAHGYTAYGKGGELLAMGAAPQVNVVDTVGAGDAFLSMYLVGVRRNWPLADSLRRAAMFAADVCTLHGAVSDDMDFYANWRERTSVNLAS